MENALMQGFYRVVSQQQQRVVVELCDASHPLFRAHFENNPLLPGFMQLDIIAEIEHKKVDAIQSAKFMKMILPGMRIVYELEVTKKGWRIRVSDEEGSLLSDFRVQWH